MTAQVKTTRDGTKPVTSAQKRREQAEVRKLVDNLPPRLDADYAKLAAVGTAMAAALGRPVHWQPAGYTGNTHVAIPVDDLLEIARRLFEHVAFSRFKAEADAAWVAALDAFPAEESYGGDAPCGCPILAIVRAGHRDECLLPSYEAADAVILADDGDTEEEVRP